MMLSTRLKFNNNNNNKTKKNNKNNYNKMKNNCNKNNNNFNLYKTILIQIIIVEKFNRKRKNNINIIKKKIQKIKKKNNNHNNNNFKKNNKYKVSKYRIRVKKQDLIIAIFNKKLKKMNKPNNNKSMMCKIQIKIKNSCHRIHNKNCSNSKNNNQMRIFYKKMFSINKNKIQVKIILSAKKKIHNIFKNNKHPLSNKVRRALKIMYTKLKFKNQTHNYINNLLNFYNNNNNN